MTYLLSKVATDGHVHAVAFGPDRIIYQIVCQEEGPALLGREVIYPIDSQWQVITKTQFKALVNLYGVHQ